MASLSSLLFLSRTRTRSSFLFFIFLLYFSMHACNSNARSLRVTNNAGSLKEFLDCKIGSVKIELSKDPFRQGANEIGQQYVSPSSRIPLQFDSIVGSNAKEEKEGARTKSGLTPFDYVVGSVSTSSWHKINHDKHAGLFYADYSRPRTRRPSHN